MAAMIINKPKKYFNENEKPDLETAVIYTVLQYGVQANTNKEIDVKYGKWIDFGDPSEDPYYIALDVDDENKIIAYRSIDSSKVSANLEIYHSGWNDDDDYYR